jgi:hypothetical protein
MAQAAAADNSVEAARSRIQRLVDEIAALSKKDLRSEEFFQQFLVRAVQATDARGGAVWLVGQRAADGKSEFQLAAQVEFETSLFHQDDGQHALLLRTLGDVVQGRKAAIIPPEPPAPDPGSLQAQMAQITAAPVPQGSTNRTPFPFFHIPLLLKDQVLGVLQMWLQPYVTQQNYGEFVTFLTSLGAHVEQHLQSRRLGNLVMENQRLQHVLKFTSDLAGSLDPLEVARLAANYGRDLIGCERCSVLTLRGDRWAVVSISGQETVEKKSALVKAMVAFIGAHARPEAFLKPEPVGAVAAGAPPPAGPRHELLLLSKKELLARAEAAAAGEDAGSALPLAVRRTDEIDLAYFEHSHVVSAAIAPMFDAENQLTGAYFAESTSEGFFDGPGGGREGSATGRLTEWLATHTGKALKAAQDYRSLPLLGVTRRMRDVRLAATGHRRRRFFFRTFLLLAILAGIAIYPKQDQVDGNCALSPMKRAIIVPEVPGRVDKVLAREGARVTKGQPIAHLDTTRMETELEGARQERLRTQAEAERFRGLGDEAQAQVYTLQANVAAKNVEKLQRDIEAATLRSPIDGVVLTKDLELHAGEFIQPGTPFAEVAALDAWELQVEVNEKKIGRVEREFEERRPLDVSYILYSQSAFKLHTQLASAGQISAAAYPRETENVFIVTAPNIEVPEQLRNDLRPGLTGRAKIQLGREPFAIWAGKRIADWFRLKMLG